MDRHRFNADVRPYLTEIPIGEQGIAYDRLELDDWVDDYKTRNGRRPKASYLEDDECLNETTCQGSVSRATSGISRSAASTPQAGGSGKARARLAEVRQKKS
jgi:hypothetical protein